MKSGRNMAAADGLSGVAPDPACLAPRTIDRLASQAPLASADDLGAAAHLAACVRCRGLVEEARRNRPLLAKLEAWARADDEDSAAAHPSGQAGAPDALPGYRTVGVLGHGAQAVVWRAVHLESRREVAVKVIGPGSTRKLARMQREAQLAATLRHPNIVAIHDCGALANGGFAIAMELVEGETLDAWLRGVAGSGQGAKAQRRRVANVFARICEAVAHAHRRGVIHRDLKPGNILVDADDQPHVVDFGVARAADPHAPSITHSGAFSGTLAYASPEQVSGEVGPADTLGDVYALGMLLHEAIVGRPPYSTEGSVEQLVHAIVHVEPARPRDDAAGRAIDRDLGTIVLKALAKDPARRYDSAAALGRDLRCWIDGCAIEARRDSLFHVLRTFGCRHRVVVALAASIALLAAASVAALSVMYGAAKDARNEASARAAQLGDRVFESNLGRALLLMASNQPGPAEAIVWREALAPAAACAVGAGPDQPDFLAILWTLRQLFARNPCMVSRIVGDAHAGEVADAGPGEAIVAWFDGTLARVRAPDLAILETWTVDTAGLKPGARVACDRRTGRVATTYGGQRTWIVESERAPRLIHEQAAEARVWAMDWDAEGHVCQLLDSGRLESLDPVDGRVVRSLDLPLPASLHGFGCFGAGMVVYAPNDSSELLAFELATGRRIGALDPVGRWMPNDVAPVAICDDGRVLTHITGLDVWTPATGETTNACEFRGGLMRLSAPRQGATMAVVVTEPGVLRLIDVDRPNTALAYSGHPTARSRPATAAWTGPHTLVTGGEGGLLRCWDSRPGRWAQVRPAHAVSIDRLAWMPDRRTLASFGRDGVARLWTADGECEPFPLPPGTIAVRSAFSPDGALFAHDDRRGKARIVVRRFRDGTPIAEHPGSGSTGPIEFSPDGRMLAAGLGPDGLALLDVERGAWRTLPPTGAGFSRIVRFSPDGRTFVWCESERRMFLMDPESTELPPPTMLRAPIRGLAFSHDGARFVTSHDDGHIVVWDRASAAVLFDAIAHAYVASAVAWAPDGRTFASADFDGEIAIWCATTFRRLATLRRDHTPIHTLVFSPDGDRLIIGDDRGMIVEWRLNDYDEAIARNVDAWIELLRRDDVPTPNAETMRAWAAGVLGAIPAPDR